MKGEKPEPKICSAAVINRSSTACQTEFSLAHQ